MKLMDDHLFDLWLDEQVEMEDILGKAQDPDSLAKRVATARRQMMELEDEDYVDEEDMGEEDDEDEL